MIIKLPFPDAELFPNRKNGAHYRKTKEVKDKQRDDAFSLTKQAARAYQVPTGHIPLSIVFVEPSAHHRDLDNMLAAAKAAIDGMAKALGVDDKVFQPVLIDRGGVQAPGAMICAVGVSIVSGANLA